MPEDKEVLGFELEFLADNNELEKIQKLLQETNGDVEKLRKAIGFLNRDWGLWKGNSTRSKDPIKKEEWSKKAKALKKVADELRDSNDQIKTYNEIVSFVPGSTKNNIAKEKVDNINIADIIDKKFQNVIKDENLKKTTTKFYKNSDEPIERKTYQTKTKEKGKIYTRNVVTEGENIISSNETIDDINKKLGKGGGASKFLSRVKNIVVYRLVRVAMSAITKGVNEGFELLSSNNSAYKDVINSLKASTTALSVTFAQLLLPIAESLSSVLEGLTTRLIDSANAMALQQAMLNGEQKYFKLSKKSIDEYAKSLSNANKSLSQLDKFATLSQGKPLLGTWEDVSSSTEKEIENAKQISHNYKAIYAVANALLKVLEWIGEVILWVSNLSDGWKTVLGVGVLAAIAGIIIGVNKLSSVISIAFSKPLLLGFIAALYVIAKILTSELPKGIKIVSAALLGIATILAFITALIPGGQARIIPALSAAIFATAGLAVAGIGSLSKNSTSPDTGASQASYDNPLASGGALASNDQDLYNNVQRSRTVTTQTSTSDVYLDGNKVGKTLTKTVFSYGAKGGYL